MLKEALNLSAPSGGLPCPSEISRRTRVVLLSTVACHFCSSLCSSAVWYSARVRSRRKHRTGKRVSCAPRRLAPPRLLSLTPTIFGLFLALGAARAVSQVSRGRQQILISRRTESGLHSAASTP